MSNSSHVASMTKYRKDYLPSPFLIDHTELIFRLWGDKTLVQTRLSVHRNPDSLSHAADLTLDGENIALKSVSLDNRELSISEYTETEIGLTLHRVPDCFELLIETEIHPEQNTALEGLYTSNGKFCTQCEAEGFRRITYYLDRPDVLACFKVRIEADKTDFPLLLSNGNRIEQGSLDDNRHYVLWQDPYPKPCYLFALVAGDLDVLEDTFTTTHGRKVQLQLFVDKGKLDQCSFAMQSLKKAMRWDEQRYQLEYDLDLYMIVAVGDFNMGAMENKGLNVFNTKYVLANAQTATDQDFENIESVIGHEYFHNWTGNRVTCRDWFQLSLKEGLTVFRDQQFTEDMRSKAVKRIDDVKIIRSHQFAEDAGPMAHPIRPDAYIEMNNFYTVTVYNKGAEVIRMLQTLLAEEGFQKGMQLYFQRHDGHAVTCDDFVDAMQSANHYDLQEFKRWYSQAGTPILTVKSEWIEDLQQMRLDISQSSTHTSAVHPFLIPLKLGLVSRKGKTQSFSLQPDSELVEETVVLIKESQQTVLLHQVSEDSVASLLRDFSAPVKLNANYSSQDLAFLFAHDSNTFTRWDAGQQLMQRYIFGHDDHLLTPVEMAFRQIMDDPDLDPAFKARALVVPDLKALFEASPQLGIDHLVTRHRDLVRYLATQLQSYWRICYDRLHQPDDRRLDGQAVGERALKNLALFYLGHSGVESVNTIDAQFQSAWLMTDELSALQVAVRNKLPNATNISQRFYKKWQQEALVMDKWLSVLASVDDASAVEDIQKLRKDPVFDIKNPNKVRALYSSFAQLNFAQFHRQDGEGYRIVIDLIHEVDSINAQIAANLMKQFSITSQLDPCRKQQVKPMLESVRNKKDLSNDVFEIVDRILQTLISSQNVQ